jgi:hypothetical protein
LVCETFLSACPTPMATRGRHGMYCPATLAETPPTIRMPCPGYILPCPPVHPRLIWLLTQRKVDDTGPWTDLDVHPYLGTDRPSIRQLRVKCNLIQNRNLSLGFAVYAPSNRGYCVSLLRRNAYMEDGGVADGSIAKSVGVSGPIPYKYRGPMLLCAAYRYKIDHMTISRWRTFDIWLIIY